MPSASPTPSSATSRTRGRPRGFAPTSTSAWPDGSRRSRARSTRSSGTTSSRPTTAAPSWRRRASASARSARGERARLEAAARAALARGWSRQGHGCWSAPSASCRTTPRCAPRSCPSWGRRSSRRAGSRTPTASSRRRSRAPEAQQDPRLESRARVERQFVRLQAESSQGHRRRRGGTRAPRSPSSRSAATSSAGAGPGASWPGSSGPRAGAPRRTRPGGERRRARIAAPATSGSGSTPCAGGRRRRSSGRRRWRRRSQRCEEIRREVAASPVAVAATLHPLAALRAMVGRLRRGAAPHREGNEILDELGGLHCGGLPPRGPRRDARRAAGGGRAAPSPRVRAARGRWASGRCSRPPRRCSPGPLRRRAATTRPIATAT